MAAAAAGAALAAARDAVGGLHPSLQQPWRGPPEGSFDAAATALCLFELLARHHDAPLLGAAPEAMLSCQRDVAAMVFHDAANPSVKWVERDVWGDAPLHASAATHVRVAAPPAGGVGRRSQQGIGATAQFVDLTPLDGHRLGLVTVLHGAASLTVVDVSPLRRVVTADKGVFRGCTALQRIVYDDRALVFAMLNCNGSCAVNPACLFANGEQELLWRVDPVAGGHLTAAAARRMGALSGVAPRLRPLPDAEATRRALEGLVTAGREATAVLRDGFASRDDQRGDLREYAGAAYAVLQSAVRHGAPGAAAAMRDLLDATAALRRSPAEAQLRTLNASSWIPTSSDAQRRPLTNSIELGYVGCLPAIGAAQAELQLERCARQGGAYWPHAHHAHLDALWRLDPVGAAPAVAAAQCQWAEAAKSDPDLAAYAASVAGLHPPPDAATAAEYLADLVTSARDMLASGHLDEAHFRGDDRFRTFIRIDYTDRALAVAARHAAAGAAEVRAEFDAALSRLRSKLTPDRLDGVELLPLVMLQRARHLAGALLLSPGWALGGATRVVKAQVDKLATSDRPAGPNVAVYDAVLHRRHLDAVVAVRHGGAATAAAAEIHDLHVALAEYTECAETIAVAKAASWL